MSFTTKLLDILSINATAAKEYIDKIIETKQDKIVFDAAPKSGSSNLVTSDGIRRAIDSVTPRVDLSNYPTKNGTGATGTWPISISGAATKASQDSNGKVIADTYATKTALGAKQDKLTFDATPTENSTNPVTSDGIKKAIDISSADNVQYEKLDGHAINSIIKAGKIVPPSEKLQFNPPTPGIVFEERNSNIKYGSVDIRALGEGNGKISFSFYEPGAVELSSYTLDEYGNFSGNAASATKASQDAAGNVIADTYLRRSGGTMTGALNFANTTWNLVGDDAYMGDHNVSGTVCFKGANGITGIALFDTNNENDYAQISFAGGDTINFNKKLRAYLEGDAQRAFNIPTSDVGGNIWIA